MLSAEKNPEENMRGVKVKYKLARKKTLGKKLLFLSG